ncbi:cell wall elongation regulator TseB-like domain-containing protein [Ureibacillus acetophenoni]
MKNWVVFIILFILSVSLVISILVLSNAMAPIKDIEQKAEELAISSNSLSIVTDSYIYNGNKPYVTVFGEDEEGNEKAVFVPISLEEKSIQEVYLQDGISKEEALSVINQEEDVKKILHTKLGYEEAGVVWEITYTNEAEKLNYVYILFENGQWWKRILNL